MFTEIPALVRGVDHNGVLCQTGVVEILQHAADAVVDRLHTAQVILDVTLVHPLDPLPALQVGLAKRLILRPVGGIPKFLLFRREIIRAGVELEIIRGQVPSDGHRLVRGSLGAPGVIVPKRLRLGDLHVVKRVEVSRSGLPVAVRRLVLEHQHERLVALALVLQPLKPLVGDDVGRVADVFLDYHLPDGIGRTHRWIVVRPLPDQHVEVIKPGRHTLQVPLTDHCRLVAGLAKQLGKRLLRPVKRRAAVPQKTVQVTVLAGEDDRAAWPTDRIRHVAFLEAHPLVRDTVDVRRLVDPRTVGADRMRRVVIRENENHIRPLGRLGLWRCHHATQHRHSQQCHRFLNESFHGKSPRPSAKSKPERPNLCTHLRLAKL